MSKSQLDDITESVNAHLPKLERNENEESVDLKKKHEEELRIRYKDIAENHEVCVTEIGYKPEGDLKKSSCKKNPGHVGFIPVKKFSKEDLPDPWKQDLTYAFIQSLAALTVRINGKCISRDRPEGFAFSELRGRRINMWGTGWVGDVPITPESPCYCKECNKKPGTLAYTFRISTANHVIFNHEEAKEASIDFDFDDPEDSSSVVTLKNLGVDYSDSKYDWCDFTCLTHDRDFHIKIYRQWRWFNDLLTELMGATETNYLLPYHVIVSHPHGYSKQVSFGEKPELVENGKYSHGAPRSFLRYRTPTCAGTSGACANFGFFGDSAGVPHHFHFPFYRGAHHGIDSACDGYNKSVEMTWPLQMYG